MLVKKRKITDGEYREYKAEISEDKPYWILWVILAAIIIVGALILIIVNTNKVCQNECMGYKSVCVSEEQYCTQKNFWGNCIAFANRCTQYSQECINWQEVCR